MRSPDVIYSDCRDHPGDGMFHASQSDIPAMTQRPSAADTPWTQPARSAPAATAGVQQDIQLRYCVSDLCLFRIGFRATCQTRPFDPNALPVDTPPPLEGFPSGVDVLVRSGVPLARRLPALKAFRNSLCYVRNQVPNHYIDLQRGPFEQYVGEFSSKTRATILRKVRNASGAMQCRVFRTVDEALEFHALARRVAVKTYQEKLFDGAIPADEAFIARMRRLAERDCFRGYVLSDGDTPVSYLYLPVENDVLIYGYLGYDPAYAKSSVGTVLLFMALERIYAENRFRYFDFTLGHDQTKTLFGRGSFLRADLHYFRWGPRNIAAVYGHVLIDRFSALAGRYAEALGMREKVRKLLRRA